MDNKESFPHGHPSRSYRRTKRWYAVNDLLQPAMPAPRIVKYLKRKHGITITTRGVYNWRHRGVSEECTPAVAEMLGVPVDEVLRASGKLS